MRWHRLAFVLFLALSASAALAEDTPAPAKKENGGKSEKTDKTDKASSEKDEEFDVTMLPAGEPVKGIKIPYYGADGTTLQMMLDADTAKRLDDTHIEMENLNIEAYSEDGRKFFIEFPESVFNVETRMLSGDKGVVIRRDDFEIRGDGAEFDVKSRYGKVLGNVKMIIFNTDDIE